MTKAKSIMLQGTSSNVGKSVLCTALCRIFKEDKFKVAPYKAQNMALNSYVTIDGGEIGRAQGAQAEAAGVDAAVEMNPILIKPKQDMEAQIIVMGKPYKDMSAKAYRAEYLPKAVGLVKDCIDSLKDKYEVIVIEGAGSPAEVNLKDRDIVNMKTAELADSPVLLVADIDRGGVFASLVGTLELLEPEERDRVAGFIINKFRGDIDLLKPGLEFIEEKTGKPVLGVIPYLHQHGIDQEDSVSLQERRKQDSENADIEIAVIELPRISNFTDVNVLYEVPGVNIRYVKKGEKIGNPDVVILPGTKNSIMDLLYLKEEGYFEEIKNLAYNGKWIVGICGGYQMLGNLLHDPEGTEAGLGSIEGLGLLDMETSFYPQKSTHQVQAKIVNNNGFWKSIQGSTVKGYEIHMGTAEFGDKVNPLVRIILRSGEETDVNDGAASLDGKIFGTHLHDFFNNTNFLVNWINCIRSEKNLELLEEKNFDFARREEAYSKIAANVRKNIDMKALYEIMNLKEK